MTFIIAECGVNFRDLVDADDMIREAAKAGADAVKWQCYKPDFSTNHIIPQRYHPRADELNAIALDESTIRYLYWRCKQHGMEFMCTPFYPEAVAMLDPFVERWKIRYMDRRNDAILNPCRATGKEMLISGDNIFCIPEYPPSWESWPVDGSFLKYDGWSCHEPFIDGIVNAVSEARSKYLEVHARLDRYEPHYCPIDTAVSITMSELAELCRRLKK